MTAGHREKRVRMGLQAAQDHKAISGFQGRLGRKVGQGGMAVWGPQVRQGLQARMVRQACKAAKVVKVRGVSWGQRVNAGSLGQRDRRGRGGRPGQPSRASRARQASQEGEVPQDWRVPRGGTGPVGCKGIRDLGGPEVSHHQTHHRSSSRASAISPASRARICGRGSRTCVGTSSGFWRSGRRALQNLQKPRAHCQHGPRRVRSRRVPQRLRSGQHTSQPAPRRSTRGPPGKLEPSACDVATPTFDVTPNISKMWFS